MPCYVRLRVQNMPGCHLKKLGKWQLGRLEEKIAAVLSYWLHPFPLADLTFTNLFHRQPWLLRPWDRLFLYSILTCMGGPPSKLQSGLESRSHRPTSTRSPSIGARTMDGLWTGHTVSSQYCPIQHAGYCTISSAAATTCVIQYQLTYDTHPSTSSLCANFIEHSLFWHLVPLWHSQRWSSHMGCVACF